MEGFDLFNRISQDVSKRSITEIPNLYQNEKEEVTIEEVPLQDQAEPHSDSKEFSNPNNERPPGHSSGEEEKLAKVKMEIQHNLKSNTNTVKDFNKYSQDASKRSLTEFPNLYRNEEEVPPQDQVKPHSDSKEFSNPNNERPPGHSSGEEEKLAKVKMEIQHNLKSETSTDKVFNKVNPDTSKTSITESPNLHQNAKEEVTIKEVLSKEAPPIKNGSTSRSLGSFEWILNDIEPRIIVGTKLSSRDTKENSEFEESKQSPNKNIRKIPEGYEVIETMGKSGQGTVMKVRNQFGEIKVLKLYGKDDEISFAIELNSILEMSSDGYEDGGLGFSNFFETDEAYGFVIDAGVGTLEDFIEFLQTTGEDLTEEQLFQILFGIKYNYDLITEKALCHRDIKPHNIILHWKNLALEIIDYGLSVSIQPPRSLSKVAGTKGYIDPNLYCKQTNYTTEDLISSDYFALGVTILQLADLKYFPKQNDIDEPKNRLKKLSETKKKLSDVLKVLLDGTLDEKIKLLKQYEEKFPWENNKANSGFLSGLENYHSNFSKYMLNKSEKTTIDNKVGSNERATIRSPEAKLAADIFFRNGLKKRESELLDIQDSMRGLNYGRKNNKQKSFVQNMKTAAEHYLKDGQKWKALQAYENIIKFYLQSKNSFEYSAWSFVLYNMILEEENSKAISNPFLFSTLGTAFSLINEVEKAEAMFIQGLERAHGLYIEPVLLNNYGCLLFELKKDNRKHQEIFESAYEKIKKLVSDAPGAIMKKWLTLDVSESKANILHFIQTVEERSVEIVRSLKSFVSNKEEEARKEKISLVWIIFSNICFEHADCLRRILESDKCVALLDKIDMFFWQFQRHKRATFKLTGNLEIFRNIIEFHKLFVDEKFSRSELQKLIEESEAIHQESTYLFHLFQEENINLSFQELKETDFLKAMVGFTLLKPRKSFGMAISNKQLLDEKISVIPESIHSIQITIMKRSFDLTSLGMGSNEQVEQILLASENEPVEQILLASENEPQMSGLKLASYGINITLKCLKEKDSKAYFLNALNFSNSEAKVAYVSPEELNSKLYESLSPRRSLQDLSLSKLRKELTGATDKDMQEIAQCIYHSRSIKCVNLTLLEGSITLNGLKCLGEAIKGLEHLKSLRVKFDVFHNITDESISLFAEILIELPALRDLTLKFIACPRVSRNGIEKVKDLLRKRRSLKSKRLYIQITRMYHLFWLD